MHWTEDLCFANSFLYALMLRSRVLLTIDRADRLGSRLWGCLGQHIQSTIELVPRDINLMNHISDWNNMEKILSSRGFDHKIEQKYQPCRIGSLCDLGFFFCMNIYRWLLCWSLNIDIAYNQDPESCANISPNSRHCSLIFCYSNFHHGFLFFFLVFISPTSFQSWYIYDVSCIFWNTTPTWIRLFYLSMRWLFDSQRDLFLYKKWGIFTAIPSYPYVKQLMASQSIDYEFLNEIVCES